MAVASLCVGELTVQKNQDQAKNRKFDQLIP